MTESKNIQSELIPKIATGFCGGISRTGGTCGAVSGAIMAINLFYGRNTSDESSETNYMMVQKFIDMFTSKFNTTNCKELIGCDLGTDEGQYTFHSNNLIDHCGHYIEKASEMVTVLIE